MYLAVVGLEDCPRYSNPAGLWLSQNWLRMRNRERSTSVRHFDWAVVLGEGGKGLLRLQVLSKYKPGILKRKR